MYDIAVILSCLCLLMLLAFRGGNMVLLAPVMATLAVLAAEQGRLLASFTQIFMPAMGEFIISFFPLFLLGAVFGKLMDTTGSARALAHGIVRWLGSERAILAVVLSCAVMTFGGVSLFVVAFATYPVAVGLFRQADIPRRLMPATIGLGAFTFTMSALPGSPSIQNAIPMPFFGTTPFAAPGLGLIAAAIMFLGGWRWLEWKAGRMSEGFGASDPQEDGEARPNPPLVLAALPLVLVLILNALFTWVLIPRMDTSYLALPVYGETTVEDLRGIWSVIAALGISILTLLAMNLRHRKLVVAALYQGADDSLQPIFNTASLVGFGAVVASLSGFRLITERMMELGTENMLVSLALAASFLAGLTGSASGGMSIALSTLGDNYLALADARGVAPELLHRVTTLATGSLDTLPHNGAVITLLTICGVTHRQAYGAMAMVCILFPVLALLAVILLGSVFGSF
ncbi:GntP family permease [Paracoccus sp. NGMCC 1.201697]|uniref:GntP family permease n=1 Tax=Paracoccus broussonetiae subsp. drimophilus TaxID=3373869 RepID=A0ABW7LQN6_9RHOB